MKKAYKTQPSNVFFQYKNDKHDNFQKTLKTQNIRVKKQENNIVYKHMRTQKIIMQLFEKFANKRSQSTIQKTSKTQAQLEENQRSFQTGHHKNYSMNLKDANKNTITESEYNSVSEATKWNIRHKTLSHDDQSIVHVHLKSASQFSSYNDSPNKIYLRKKRMKEVQKQQKDQLQTKILAFNRGVRKFQNSLGKSQKAVKILNKLNTMTEHYTQMIPKDMAEQTRQSLEQNQLIIKICQEEEPSEKKKKQLIRKAENMIKYREPLILDSVQQQFYKNIRQKRTKEKKNTQIYKIRRQIFNNKRGVMMAFKNKNNDNDDNQK